MKNKKIRIDTQKLKSSIVYIILYTLLFAAFLGIILSFFLLFKGFHEVDLFVNRAVMFNDLYVDAGVCIEVRAVNETGIDLRTGQEIIIPHLTLYSNGVRQIFLGFFLLFFAVHLYIFALHALIKKPDKKDEIIKWKYLIGQSIEGRL